MKFFHNYNILKKETKVRCFPLQELQNHRLVVTAIGLFICDALRNLVPFAQFKKCEKHPWKGITVGKVAGLPNRTKYHI